MTLSPESGTSLVGETVTFTADVTGSPGGTVVFTATPSSGGEPESQEDNDTPFTWSFPSYEADTYVIEASYTPPDLSSPVDSNEATHRWEEPSVTLAPDTQTSAPGDVASFTVTVNDGDVAPSDVDVEVSGTNSGVKPSLTGKAPTFTATYTSKTEGVDKLVAVVYFRSVERSVRSNVAVQTWKNVPPTFTVRSDGDDSIVGDTAEFTLTVADAVVSVDDIRAWVTGVNSSVEPVVSGQLPVFTISYTGVQPGDDQLWVAVHVPSLDKDFSVPSLRHHWDLLTSVPKVRLAPDGRTSFVGDTATFTVEVSGVDDVTADDIELEIDGVNVAASPSVFGRGLTFTASYVGAARGDDKVTARLHVASMEKDFTSNTVLRRWQDRAQLEVDLGPPGVTSLVGSTFTPAVLVKDVKTGRPLSGATVAFTVSGQGVDTLRRTTVTDLHGAAGYTYARRAAGTEDVTAVATLGDRTGEATISHSWRLNASGLTLSLAPAGTTSLSGSPFTVTAVVSDADGPVTSAQVRFTVAGPSFETLSPSVPPTDGRGTTSITYTRGGGGVDTVTAEVAAHGERGQAALTHFWRESHGWGVRFLPRGTTTVVGSPFTPVVEVTLRGEPVPGVVVTFRAAAPGLDPAVGTGTTGPRGRASFTYTREVGSTDTLTADLVHDGTPGQASATHLWLQPPSDSTFTVDPPGVQPGATVTVSGSGCPARTVVLVTLAEEVIGQGRTGPDGGFSTRVQVPSRTGLDHHRLAATCGTALLEGSIDTVASISSTGAADSGAAAAGAILLFFTLLGSQVLRGR